MIALLAAPSGCAWIERSSVSSAPKNLAGSAASITPSISQSGRYVAFASAAPNLVAGDTNRTTDVFVRDNVAKTTERVSLSDDDAQSPSFSDQPAISDDGRYVAFAAAASWRVVTAIRCLTSTCVTDRTGRRRS